MSVTVLATHRRFSLPGGMPCDVELPRFLISSFHFSLDMALSSQLAQQMGEVHFGISCLEPALHGRLDLALGFFFGHRLAEEIRIATESLNRRECDSVDTFLDNGKPARRESGDSMSER